MECQAVNAGGPKEFRGLSGDVPGPAALGLAYLAFNLAVCWKRLFATRRTR